MDTLEKLKVYAGCINHKRLILACGGDPDAPAFPVPLQELNCNVRVEQMP